MFTITKISLTPDGHMMCFIKEGGVILIRSDTTHNQGGLTFTQLYLKLSEYVHAHANSKLTVEILPHATGKVNFTLA